jgi:hypothetical protein
MIILKSKVFAAKLFNLTVCFNDVIKGVVTSIIQVILKDLYEFIN